MEKESGPNIQEEVVPRWESVSWGLVIPGASFISKEPRYIYSEKRGLGKTTFADKPPSSFKSSRPGELQSIFASIASRDEEDKLRSKVKQLMMKSPIKQEKYIFPPFIEQKIDELNQIYKPKVEKDLCHNLNEIYFTESNNGNISQERVSLDLSNIRIEDGVLPQRCQPSQKTEEEEEEEEERLDEQQPTSIYGNRKLRLVSSNNCCFGCRTLRKRNTYIYQELHLPDGLLWKYDYCFTNDERIYAMIPVDNDSEPFLFATNVLSEENLENVNHRKICLNCKRDHHL